MAKRRKYSEEFKREAVHCPAPPGEAGISLKPGHADWFRRRGTCRAEGADRWE